jgi:hypothetical protein
MMPLTCARHVRRYECCSHARRPFWHRHGIFGARLSPVIHCARSPRALRPNGPRGPPAATGYSEKGTPTAYIYIDCSARQNPVRLWRSGR